MKFNSGFYKKMDLIATPTSRRAVADLAKKTAHWGIKGHGDLPMIMGILEFGDPGHTFPNTRIGSRRRKELEVKEAFGNEKNPSEIPPRPWLRRSIEGYYRKQIAKYVNENLPRVLRGFPKYGQSIVNPDTLMTTKKFIQGLAEVGAANAQKSWDLANFTPNAKATLENKDDERPLHGNGEGDNPMSADAIEAWSE